MIVYFRMLNVAVLVLGLVSISAAQGFDRERGLGRDGDREFGRNSERDFPSERRNTRARPGRSGDESGRGSQPSPMFLAVDADGDGVITNRELRKAGVALKRLDADGDGNITLAEASTQPGRGGGMNGGPGGIEDPNAMVARIMQNDRNGDEQLSPDEVPRDLMPMLSAANTNGDRVLDINEIRQAVQDMQSRARNGDRAGRGGSAEEDYRRLMASDANRDGLLSPKEVPPQMMRMLRGADLDGDGFLNNKEVQRALARRGNSERERMRERARERGIPNGRER